MSFGSSDDCAYSSRVTYSHVLTFGANDEVTVTSVDVVVNDEIGVALKVALVAKSEAGWNAPEAHVLQ